MVDISLTAAQVDLEIWFGRIIGKGHWVDNSARDIRQSNYAALLGPVASCVDWARNNRVVLKRLETS